MSSSVYYATSLRWASQALQNRSVPFAGRSDALEFLRTVPTGTNRAELERLGTAYCVAHPLPRADE